MLSSVPFLDLTRIDPELDRELIDRFTRFVGDGRYILGPEVEAFERECAEYVGAPHAIGVSSGTDALLVSLMALDIGPGDEVLCPTFTFFATAGSIWRTGARPVFVDVGLGDFNVTRELLEAKITPDTKALVVVHLFGQCADTDAIRALASERGIAIIEDAAQAFGARYRGCGAGAMGTLGCFSFFPSKNLGGFGDAGLVTTGDDRLAAKIRALRSHGATQKFHHSLVGGNFRIDALQALLLRPKLRRLDAWTAARQKNAALYTEMFLATGLAELNQGQTETTAKLLLPVARQERHIFNQYVVRVPGGRRDALRAYLQEVGIGTEIYYPVPTHLQACFAPQRYARGDLPGAELAATEVLALPIYPELAEAEIRYVVEHVGRFFSRPGPDGWGGRP
jgi:dTDP-4-amino-4,6-dideoxygalactose transaminase